MLTERAGYARHARRSPTAVAAGGMAARPSDTLILADPADPVQIAGVRFASLAMLVGNVLGR